MESTKEKNYIPPPKFAINLSNFSLGEIVDLAVRSDELGYDSVWMNLEGQGLPWMEDSKKQRNRLRGVSRHRETLGRCH